MNILLDDYTTVPLEEFDEENMLPIGVQVRDNLYITLKDFDYNGKTEFTWERAQIVGKMGPSYSFLPSIKDWKEYIEYRYFKQIDEALTKIHAVPICLNEKINFYWSSSEYEIPHHCISIYEPVPDYSAYAWGICGYHSHQYQLFLKDSEKHVRLFIRIPNE